MVKYSHSGMFWRCMHFFALLPLTSRLYKTGLARLEGGITVHALVSRPFMTMHG